MTGFTEIWSYLARDPLLWLSATLAAYWVGDWMFRVLNRNPAANPVLIAVFILALGLGATGTAYDTYFEGAQFVHFLLGPATVALAVPLHRNIAEVRRVVLPLIGALIVGSVTAMSAAVGIAWALGASPGTLSSLVPKSTTAPVALGIAEATGGSPTLTAVLVILTGMIGAIVITPLMDALRVTDYRARGFAVGVAAHGIGTARAFQVNETAGTFAGIGMGANALLTALLAPVFVRLFL